MASDLFSKWIESQPSKHQGVSLFGERKGARMAGLKSLKKLVASHFVGDATILKAGGYAKSAAIIANSLPANKRTRSGDLGELLATEYVNSQTTFRVALNKLRWKSDREMPMHGNDIVGVDATQDPVRVLKGECKSRASFSAGVVSEAAESLDAHAGRPNPSTLAFITKRLYDEGHIAEGDVFRDLQCKRAIPARTVTHLIFALSGNNPAVQLSSAPKPKRTGIRRESAAIIISDPETFIDQVFS